MKGELERAKATANRKAANSSAGVWCDTRLGNVLL